MPTSSRISKILLFFKPLKLDWYILEEVITTFIGASVFILFILLMFQALRLAEFFVIHGVSALVLGKLAFFMALFLTPSVVPLAFLIAVLMAFSRLSADSELVAMKANGLSLYRMSMPVFGFSIAIAALSLALNVDIVPWGETVFRTTQNKIANTKVITAVKEGAFTSGFFDLLLFADKADTKTNRMMRVFIYDEREAKNPLTYVAREAEVVPLKTDSELTSAVMLNLFDGSMHHHNLETHMYEKVDFDTYHLYLKIDEGADTTLLKPHMIPQEDLLRRIKKFGLHTYEGREFRGEYWRRQATALSPIIFVIIGIGFGAFRLRTAKAGAILISFIILFIYWFLQTYGTAALLKGIISPFLAMYLPNLIMLLIGVIRFRRAAW